MNKYERNAIQVSLDYCIDKLIDVNKQFDNPIKLETIVNLGCLTLKLIEKQLKDDIKNTNETIDDNWDDKTERNFWLNILDDQQSALTIINKAITQTKLREVNK